MGAHGEAEMGRGARRVTPHARGPTSFPLRHPLRFLWEAVKEFRKAQGLLLAGAVAYYTML